MITLTKFIHRKSVNHFQDDTQLSKLVLEDYLISLALWESEQMMTYFGGCEH